MDPMIRTSEFETEKYLFLSLVCDNNNIDIKFPEEIFQGKRKSTVWWRKKILIGKQTEKFFCGIVKFYED